MGAVRGYIGSIRFAGTFENIYRCNVTNVLYFGSCYQSFVDFFITFARTMYLNLALYQYFVIDF